MTSSWADKMDALRLDLLASVTLDAYLLSRAIPASSTDGRGWERAVGTVLRRPDLTRRQGPGLVTLWDRRPASGARHELDAAAAGGADTVVLEAKASAEAVTKAELAHFHIKTFDYYCAAVRNGERSSWWRIVASAAPPKRSARALCAHLGLMLCDPSVLPLPVLLRAASKPVADQHLPEPLLREAVRLFEPAVRSMDQIWRPSACSRQLTLNLEHETGRELDDLLYVQKELSDALLDLYDRVAPGRLEQRTAKLLMSAGALAGTTA